MYVVIAGAGLVGQGLIQELIDLKHDVVVIERDKDLCERLAARFEALILNGEANSVDVLEQAGITRADAAVGTMRADADNLSFSLLAKSFGVPRVIARMRDPRYEQAYRQAGVSTTVHVSRVFVNQLLLDIEQPHLRRITSFGGGKASIVVDTVPEVSAASGKTVSEIASDPDFPQECIITGIYRGEAEKFIIPRGSAQVLGGDRVFLVAEHANLKKASKFLHRTR